VVPWRCDCSTGLLLLVYLVYSIFATNNDFDTQTRLAHRLSRHGVLFERGALISAMLPLMLEVFGLDGSCATRAGTIGRTVSQCDPRERHGHVHEHTQAQSDKTAALWASARCGPALVLRLHATPRAVLPPLPAASPSQTSHTQTIETPRLVMTSSCYHTCSCLMRAASCRAVMVAVCAVYTLLRNDHHLAARLHQWRIPD
jgi:hypothetical protein